MYRAHLVVTENGNRLSVDTLRERDLGAVARSPHLLSIGRDGTVTWHPGTPGTRYGVPGIWVRVTPDGFRRDTADRFRSHVLALTNRLRGAGLDVTVTATNDQSVRALFGLVKVRRG